MELQLLLECDLFKVLVELSGVDNEEISKRAQYFLKETTTLMYELLPNSN